MIGIERGTHPQGRRLPGLLRPTAYVQALRELAAMLTRKRALTIAMARRELTAEHSAHAFGSFWGVAQPLFLILLYAFIFGVVFKQKVGGTFELPLNFTIYMLSGLVPWLAFQVSMVKSASVISGNANLVKQVVFELEILPVAGALAACVPLAIGLAFVMLYTLADYGTLPVTYLLLPVVVVLQVLAMAGVAFIASALGAFFRDIREIITMFALAAIFIMPIVYLPDNVPGPFQPVLWANPFTYMVWCYQDVLYFGRIEHPYAWLVFAAWSLFAFAGGYRLFRKVKPYFGNVL